MALRNLNMSFLRSRGGSELPARPGDLSRRGFLQLSGAAIAGVASSPLAKFNSRMEDLRVIEGKNRVALQVNGKDRFVVDGNDFCGRPVVGLRRRGSEYLLSLSEARFPGAVVPADFFMKIWQDARGWRFSVRMEAAASDFVGDLYAWLLDRKPAEFRRPQSGPLVKLEGAAVSQHNADLLSLTPDWLIAIAGPSAIQVELEGQKANGDRLTLRLTDSSETSFVRNLPQRRTEVCVHRDRHDWPFASHLPEIAEARLQSTGPVFDRITLHMGESQNANVRYGTLYQGGEGEALVLRPTPDAVDGDGKIFELLLDRARLARSPETGESYFSAGIAGDGTNALFGDVTYRFSDSKDGPAVEATNTGRDDPCKLCVSVSADRTVLLPGAVVETNEVPRSAGLKLTFGEIVCDVGTFLHLSPHRKVAYGSANDLCLKIVRPRDLMVVDLRFKGMHFEHAFLGATHLVPDGTGEAARIVATFSPQAIVEQCIPDKGCGADPNGAPPPIPRRMARPSRLVFCPFLSNGKEKKIEKIPLELESLLGWSGWELGLNKFATEPTVEDGTFSPDGRIQENFSYKGNIQPVNPDLAKRLGLLDKPNEPAEDETAIELPYGLIVSPNKWARFDVVNTQTSPVSKRAALWHTKLRITETGSNATSEEGGAPSPKTLKKPNQPRRLPGVRIIYQRQMSGQKIACVPISDCQREELLTAFTTYVGDTNVDRRFVPPAIPTDLMVLSEAGGWLRGGITWEPLKVTTPDACGGYNEPSGLTLDVAQGHDNHIVITYDGYLMPFGHAVTYVQETKKEWEELDGKLYSYEVQYKYLLIAEHKKIFPTILQPFEGHQIPFSTIEITVDRTPNLSNGDEQHPFWPKTMLCSGGEVEYRFPLRLTDVNGNVTYCDVPAEFIPKSTAFNYQLKGWVKASTDYQDRALGEWNTEAARPQPATKYGTVSQVPGQKIAFALSSKPGDTHFPTSQIFWSVAYIDPTVVDEDKFKLLQHSQQPPWYPILWRAKIEVDSLRGVGTNTDDCTTYVEYADRYLTDGFVETSRGTNKGEVFLQLAKYRPAGTATDKVAKDLGLKFGGSNSGGIAAPSMDISGLSRRLGPVGGAINTVADAQFKPGDFFGSAGPSILGVVDLATIIAEVLGFDSNLGSVPQLIKSEVHDLAATVQQVTGVVEEIKSKIHTAASTFDSYRSAAAGEITALQNSTINDALAQVGSALEYIDVPRELQAPADELTARVTHIRTDFLNQIKSVPDLSTLRELVILKATENTGIDQTTLDSFRKAFRLDSAGKVALVRAAIGSAVQQVQTQLIGASLAQIGQLLANPNAETLSSAVAQLGHVLDGLLEAASVFDRGVDQLVQLRGQIQQSIDGLTRGIADNQKQIESWITNAALQLQADAQTAVKARLGELLATASKDLDPIVSQADAILYNAGKTAKVYQALATNINSQLNAAITDQLRDLHDNLLPSLLRKLNLPTEIHLSYEFNPQMRDDPTGVFIASANNSPATLAMKTQITKYFDTRPPVWNTSADLKNFTLRLLPGIQFIELTFDELKFHSNQEGATKVDVQLRSSRFMGPLDFVNDLEDYLKQLASDVGLVLDIQPVSVTVGFEFALPSISAGMFSLSNVRFASSVRLAFLESDAFSVRFAFSQRTRPFLLSFGIFGGGGFIALELTAKGVKEVEAALEFGAVAALDLVVAKGAVQIMGGFYFRRNGDGMLLMGYFRAYGELTILSIVSMSVQFWLTLSYEQRQGGTAYLVGECTVSVDIHIGFFSVGASMTLRREFSKGSGDSASYLPARDGFTPIRAFVGEDDTLDREFLPPSDWRNRYLRDAETWAW